MSEEDKNRMLQELRRIFSELQDNLRKAESKLDEISRSVSTSPSSHAAPQTQNATTPTPQQVSPRMAPQQHGMHGRIPSPSRPVVQPVAAPTSSRPEKLFVGIDKLDELLMGGIRTSSNVLLSGPPYAGKDTLSWNFIANSLKEEIPSLIIATDKSINDIKMEISRIYPNVDQAEESGMLRFVDVYSRSIQTETQSKHSVTIDNIINISSLLKAVDLITTEFLKIRPFYTLLFSSLTSYVTELEERVMLKFVQQFAQKRKSEYSTSLYLIESGLFDKKTIEAIAYLMDGSISFRTDGPKRYLRVEGLGNVRSRDWVEIFPTDTGFELGAFTLEKIK